MSRLPNVFITAAKRTPFGKFGGKLKDFTATDLAVEASKAAIAQSAINPAHIDSVFFGNVQQTSGDAAYLARHTGLRSGLPVPSASLVVNRLCGSGFEAVASAASAIILGHSSVALAGGTESMSQAPYALRGARFGTKLGVDQKLEDTLWQGLTDSYVKLPMAITAENLAEQYSISRKAVDDYALQTQQRWGAADKAGRFNDELIEVTTNDKKNPKFTRDEHPRPETTPEELAGLKPVFKKDGVVTAGNASGICDGAAALIVAGEAAVKQYSLKPLARVVSWASIGVDPKIMGIGAAPAVREALKRAGLELKDVDLVEVNEAFGAQYLAVEKELGLDREKTNVNGGAIALGHPLAASGARILTHLIYELARRNGRYAVGSACIGGGQGIAVVIERVECA